MLLGYYLRYIHQCLLEADGDFENSICSDCHEIITEQGLPLTMQSQNKREQAL
jgi:hypothetical protein